LLGVLLKPLLWVEREFRLREYVVIVICNWIPIICIERLHKVHDSIGHWD